MQSTTELFTAAEDSTHRKIAHNILVSWKKFSTLGNRTFTIGVSTIGGNHVIGINPGAIGSPGNYQYFDESDYAIELAWERGFNIPTGGLSKALAEASLDNTSGRYTPRYMGGNGEFFTSSYKLRRPVIISAGFNVGADIVLPQFAGLTNKPMDLDSRDKTVRLQAADYMDFFQDRSLTESIIFTDQRTDQVIETLFSQMGMSTAQYELDTGINVIPFGRFDVGIKFANAVHQLAEAENAHIYQDEEGKFRFENRQHWDSSPHNQVQRIISTGQVINAQAPDFDHLVNVVEVSSERFEKQPEQSIFRLDAFDALELAPSTRTEVFVNFDDPVLSMTTPSSTGTSSYFRAYNTRDASLTDLSSSVTITKVTRFAQAAKLEFTNSSTETAYITELVINGRVARSVGDLYVRVEDSSSLTAYQERTLRIENPFIQSQDWANSYAQMIVNDFAEPENLQQLTIRAIPELQLGDLVSWQGRYWRIYNIRNMLNAAQGFVQELLLLQRTITIYFRIGISTIGGTDKIAP